MPKLTNKRLQDHILGAIIGKDGAELPSGILRAGESIEVSDAEFARYLTPALQAMIDAGDLMLGDAPAPAAKAVPVEAPAPMLEHEVEAKTLVSNLKRAKK